MAAHQRLDGRSGRKIFGVLALIALHDVTHFHSSLAVRFNGDALGVYVIAIQAVFG